MLRSDLCDFSDAYIVLKEDITVIEPDNVKRNKRAAFKNNGSFINCVSKSNGVQVDSEEDLDVVMPMHNLLEYKKITKKAAGSLWNYYRDEPSNLFLLILNLLNMRPVLQEILMMVMMMQTKLVKMKLNLLFR